ncbi:hypothetical protein PAMP_017779 [Pampus punctatissimus]
MRDEPYHLPNLFHHEEGVVKENRTGNACLIGQISESFCQLLKKRVKIQESFDTVKAPPKTTGENRLHSN